MKEILVWVGDAWKKDDGEDYTLKYLEEVNKAMWEKLFETQQEQEEEEED